MSAAEERDALFAILQDHDRLLTIENINMLCCAFGENCKNLQKGNCFKRFHGTAKIDPRATAIDKEMAPIFGWKPRQERSKEKSLEEKRRELARLQEELAIAEAETDSMMRIQDEKKRQAAQPSYKEKEQDEETEEEDESSAYERRVQEQIRENDRLRSQVQTQRRQEPAPVPRNPAPKYSPTPKVFKKLSQKEEQKEKERVMQNNGAVHMEFKNVRDKMQRANPQPDSLAPIPDPIPPPSPPKNFLQGLTDSKVVDDMTEAELNIFYGGKIPLNVQARLDQQKQQNQPAMMNLLDLNIPEDDE